MTRLLARVRARHVLGLMAVVVGLVVLAGPAQGLPLVGDCKDAPEISRPDAGFAGWVGIKPPEHPPTGDMGDPNQDPFAPGSKVSIVDTYGYGGLSQNTYDLGCGGSVRDPMAAVTTAAANLIGFVSVLVVSVSGQISDFAQHPGFLDAFDPVLTSVSQFTRDRLWLGFFPLTLIATGFFILSRSKRARFAEVTSHAGWVLIILCSSALVLGAPLKVAGWFDSGLGMATNKIHDVFAGTGEGALNGGPLVSVAPVHQHVLYDTWKAGVFGDPNSATANAYAPRLFRDSTFSWSEMQKIAHGEVDENKLRDEKQEDWKKAAGEIEEHDHDAYVNLQGRNGTNRIWRSILSVFTALASCLFIIVSGLMLLGALLVIRLFILGFPVIGIIGGFPTLRYTVMRLWDYFTGAIVNAAVMAFAAGLVSLFIGAILASNSSGVLTLFLCWLVTIIAWKASKPFRSFNTLVPGFDQALHKLTRATGQVATIAAGVSLGESAGEHQALERGERLPPPPASPLRERAGSWEPDESHTIRSLPASQHALPPAPVAALGPAATGSTRALVTGGPSSPPADGGAVAEPLAIDVTVTVTARADAGVTVDEHGRTITWGSDPYDLPLYSPREEPSLEIIEADEVVDGEPVGAGR